ncbi:hypothetical protein [Desulfoplanes sp.]
MKVGSIRYITFFLFFLFAIAAHPCSASQTVEVVWPLAPGQGVLDVRQEAMQAGFVKGVVQEANDMLAAGVSGERARLLADHLGGGASGMVLGYKVLDIRDQQDPHAMVMRLDVQVNRAATKTVLKELGLWYTSSAPAPAVLTLSGVDSADWQRLEELKGLTGVRGVLADDAMDNATAHIRITKANTESWKGDLQAFGRGFTADGTTLDAVWFELWERYFGQTEVASSVFGTIRFRIDGWYVTEGVSYFDSELAAWSKLVEQSFLVHVDLSNQCLGGVWKVRTADPDAFRVRLEKFLANRGLRLVYFNGQPISPRPSYAGENPTS